MNLPVKIKKLNDKAVIPTYGTDGSAGLDMTAISERTVLENGVDYIEYGTGIALAIPEGFVGLIFPRSSISSSTNLVLSNSVGVIDSDYTGEIKFRFKTIRPHLGRNYKIGDRIGQIVIMPYPKILLELVDELTKTDRADGAYGSTGK